jgi:hypothetical protein
MKTSQEAGYLARLYAHGAAATPSRFELATLATWIDAEIRPILERVWYTSQEVSPEAFHSAHKSSGRLVISTAHNVHPFWGYAQNARLRAVHDWHHLQSGAGYDLPGEIQAFRYAQSRAPEAIHWILFSEIVLQAAAAIHFGRFLEQKLVRV